MNIEVFGTGRGQDLENWYFTVKWKVIKKIWTYREFFSKVVWWRKYKTQRETVGWCLNWKSEDWRSLRRFQWNLLLPSCLAGHLMSSECKWGSKSLSYKDLWHWARSVGHLLLSMRLKTSVSFLAPDQQLHWRGLAPNCWTVLDLAAMPALLFARIRAPLWDSDVGQQGALLKCQVWQRGVAMGTSDLVKWVISPRRICSHG